MVECVAECSLLCFAAHLFRAPPSALPVPPPVRAGHLERPRREELHEVLEDPRAGALEEAPLVRWGPSRIPLGEPMGILTRSLGVSS